MKKNPLENHFKRMKEEITFGSSSSKPIWTNGLGIRCDNYWTLKEQSAGC
jgi:hypothetical protein